MLPNSKYVTLALKPINANRFKKTMGADGILKGSGKAFCGY